eukprot:1097720-Amphidinium_carterae.1
MSSLVDTAQAAMTGTASALRSTGSVQTDRLSQQPGRPSGREPLARTITLDHIDVSDPHAWDGGSDGCLTRSDYVHDLYLCSDVTYHVIIIVIIIIIVVVVIIVIIMRTTASGPLRCVACSDLKAASSSAA